jgi:hypothetical protein
MTAAHALLAPSAAARWMVCPGSVRLTEGRDDCGSVYSREGTAAHVLARHCLESKTDPARPFSKSRQTIGPPNDRDFKTVGEHRLKGRTICRNSQIS